MKKIVLTSLMLILVPALLFVPVYILMIYRANTSLMDYSDDIIGKWDAFQYYYENERFVCNEDNWISIAVTDDSVAIEGTLLPVTDTTYTWLSGTSLSYETDNQTITLFISFDTQNNLKVIVDDTSYIILLRRNAG